MGKKGRLLTSVEVADLLTADDLDKLARSAAAGYQCVTCGQPGQLGTAAVVVELKDLPGGLPGTPQAAHVRLAHPWCSPSQILRDSGIMPVPVDGDMTAKAAIVDGYRTLLITELSAPVSAVLDGGERQDMATGMLLSLGLHLLADPWQPAPPADGWSVTLSSVDTAVVTDPDGRAYYEGGLDQPRKWRKLVAARGTVELLAGVTGIDAATPGNPQPGLAALEAAARAGDLVGATIPVVATRKRRR